MFSASFQKLQRINLPLLLKELIEQSSRRRTYIIRVVYTSLFFLGCLIVILPEGARTGNRALNMLGLGRAIFQSIIGWQFAGIYLFLPAMACGALTVEKERNTLGLLFLTRLAPWTILFEKIAGRLVPMACLLFCSLPLLAFSFSYGGVTLRDLFSALWYLSLSAIQVCTIAVASSSFFRTTTSALLGTYAAMFFVFFGLPLTDWLVFDNQIAQTLRHRSLLTGVSNVDAEMVLFCLFGMAQFMIESDHRLSSADSVLWTLIRGIPLMMSALLPLMIARWCLVRRAFIAASNPLLLLLRMLDRTFHNLNNRLARGVVVMKEGQAEPNFAPIAWRETQKRSLGQTRYLVRILLALEVPLVLLIMWTIWRVSDNYYDAGETTSVTTLLIWLVIALLVVVSSAGLISGERGRQTLDILLALPMTGRQIILDKVSGVRRLVWVCAIPLVTSILFEGWWRDVQGPRQWGANQNYNWTTYLVTALSLVVVYLPLLLWLSLWIGLKTKSANRATLTALISVAAWCVLPVIAVVVTWEFFIAPTTGQQIDGTIFGTLMLASPCGLLFIAEFGSIHQFAPFRPLLEMGLAVEGLPLNNGTPTYWFLGCIPTDLLPACLNTVFYGVITLVLRQRVLSQADRLLGRTPPARSRFKHTSGVVLVQPGVQPATSTVQ